MSEDQRTAELAAHYRVIVAAEFFTQKIREYALTQKGRVKGRECLALAASVAEAVRKITGPAQALPVALFFFG